MTLDMRNAPWCMISTFVNFPWAEDGSPCLTLFLSPWFTRAWTALELALSCDV
jgi:hypothetical protein